MPVKKKVKLDDLNFDGLSGGTEVKTPPVQVVQAKKPKIKNEYVIPIQTPTGTVLKNLCDTSGEEFLEWAEGVFSPLKNQRLDPSLYDGAHNIEHKQELVNYIAKFYGEMMARRGFNLNTLH